MRTRTLALSLIMAAAALQGTAMAQDLLAGKPVYTLGEAKTWTATDDDTYTFITDNLAKLTEVPTNTSDIYLFPEVGGKWNTDANREIGIQGFYVDLGSSQNIGSVTTIWEGAAANSYDIYLTDALPTTAILTSTPTYSASGLGQYKENTALLPAGSRGRYLVFQPTEATNWGWGVKIRSISALAPQITELNSFSVSPAIVALGSATALKISVLDQLGLAISDATVSVSDNATYENGELTIISGSYATLTATYDGKSIEATVYAASAPAIPDVKDIKTPVFTNGNDGFNEKAEFTVAYNGGAVNNGITTFADGEVARNFGNARCIFFNNTETTGAWNGAIDPLANNYSTLNLSIFASRDVEGTVSFEGTSDPELVPVNNPFSLKAGQWNNIVVNIAGVSRLNNMSVRFTEENASDILLTNIYFSATVQTGVNVAEINVASSFDVFNTQGVCILRGADAVAVNNLPAGLYIINGHKVLVK